MRVVEAGGNEDGTRIAFAMPARNLLAGQAGSSAFYLRGRAATQWRRRSRTCAPLATDMVHGRYRQPGGAGECEIDSGPDRAVYACRLTPSGTARGPGGGPVMPDCGISLKSSKIAFGETRAGMLSAAKPPAATRAGSMPLASVTVGAGDWAA